MSLELKKLIYKSLDSELFKNKEFSLKIGVLYKGDSVFKAKFGKDYKRYELASMTKAIFVSSIVINKYPEILKKKVSDVIPWLDSSEIKVERLLTHTSGLPGHIKIYESLNEEQSELEKKTYLRNILRAEFNKLKSKKTVDVIYSDIGYLLLGEVLEAYSKKPLSKLWSEIKSDLNYPLSLDFNTSKKMTAPTEKCEWRKKLIQGEVFDRNAYMLGGVQPHTGLFGSISDMLKFGEVLRLNYKKKQKFYRKKEDGWAVGFMTPSGKLSTAGSLFSKKSIGHLGFTGTSFWFDPDKDLFVSILSNRTFPDRNNVSFNKYRPIIHDLIYKYFVMNKV